jgi:peptidoglycan/LPS O-acetylase OafA/YrhL
MSINYRREIDGLRALAVLPVILFHAGFQSFSGGFVGVDVFFVISGYLITSIILFEKQAGTFTLLNFYERRARRILPTLFIVMLACLPFAWIWLLPTDMKDFSQSLVAVTFFGSNFLFWLKSGYFATDTDLKPLLHTWSLSVEEQYYLLFPLLVLFMWRFNKRWLLLTLLILALLSLSLAQWGSHHKPIATFYLLPMRGWELLIGTFVAFYTYNNGNIVKKLNFIYSQIFALLGLSLIIYSIFEFTEDTPFPSLYTLVPTLGTALIIVFATSKTWVGRLLSHKLFVGIGLISYSAYLWHQPLFAFARHYYLDEPTLTVYLILILSSLLLAYFSWKYVEKIFRNRQAISRNWITIGSLSFGAFFVFIGLLGSKQYITSSSDHSMFNLSRDLVTSRECPNDLFPDPSIRKHCTVIGDQVPPTILLMGDSHAEALRVELEKSLLKSHLSAYSITLGGCTPIKDVSLNSELFYNECINLNRWLSDNILYKKETCPVDTLIVFSRWSAHLLDAKPFDNLEGGKEKELFINSNKAKLTGLIDNKITYDKPVIKQLYINHFKKIRIPNIVLIYPMPEAGWHIPKALSKLINRKGLDKITNETLSTSYMLFKSRNAESIELLDALGPNIIRIKPEDHFCNQHIPGRCVTQINGQPLYYDDDHISNYGARLVINSIIEQRENLIK